MSSSHAPPGPVSPGGGFSAENAPRVVVRAGKTFICSACGTLVEIPADVVGQLVLAVDPASQDKPSEQEPPAEVPPQADQPQSQRTTLDRPRSDSQGTWAHRPPRSYPLQTKATPQQRPPRPRRPRTPQRELFAGQVIDGLIVPSAKQLDRALAWVSFHLNVLDRQGSELKRLQKLLKERASQPVPCPRPRGQAKKASKQDRGNTTKQPEGSHAHENVNMAPDLDNATERGPP